MNSHIMSVQRDGAWVHFCLALIRTLDVADSCWLMTESYGHGEGMMPVSTPHQSPVQSGG